MSDSRARILFVGAFPPPGRQVFGGMVTSCRILLSSSFSNKLQLDLFDSTQVSNPPPGLLRRAWLAAIRFARFVWRLEAGRPDAILMFVAVGASIIEKGVMARYAKLRGVPSILFPRGASVIDDCERSRFTTWWVGYFFRGANRLVCQGERWHKFATSTLGFSQEEVTIVRNWTATPKVLQIGAERIVERDAAKGQMRLLFVGWLEREKGVFELLEACSRLVERFKFTLDLVGDGHALVEARAAVQSLGLSEVIRFRGWCGESEVHSMLSKSDIFVLPSWAEGLPNAMVEAMAAGLPVVATKVGAISDVVSNGINGMLVDPKSVEQLTSALEVVMGDPELRGKLAANAHALAASEFGVESAVSRILGEIDAVLKSGAARFPCRQCK